jgi:hypothetical protein
MGIRKLRLAAAGASALVLAAPVAAANADATPVTPPPTRASYPVLTFVPPSTGPICVAIGPIIIGGKMISPGVSVCTSRVSPPPFVLTFPG